MISRSISIPDRRGVKVLIAEKRDPPGGYVGGRLLAYRRGAVSCNKVHEFAGAAAARVYAGGAIGKNHVIGDQIVSIVIKPEFELIGCPDR
jgi:hypothetical protein